MLDAIIVGVVVAGAVGFLAWTFRPKKRKGASLPCGNCGCASDAPAAPVRLK